MINKRINSSSWTEVDVNVTCKSLGFSNGTFYYYAPSNNLTSHMKMFMPRCHGKESNLFECSGTANPELGLTVCGMFTYISKVIQIYFAEIISQQFWIAD